MRLVAVGLIDRDIVDGTIFVLVAVIVFYAKCTDIQFVVGIGHLQCRCTIPRFHHLLVVFIGSDDEFFATLVLCMNIQQRIYLEGDGVGHVNLWQRCETNFWVLRYIDAHNRIFQRWEQC